MKHMTTLKELIIATRCRKGTAKGTTKRGAFWLACDPITIRSYGGDGVGNNGVDWRNHLELRHYRSGEVVATINKHGWHQNSVTHNEWQTLPILDCTTIEDVIVALKGQTIGESPVYADWGQKNLTQALTVLGLPESAPSPDDEPAQA